LEPLGEEDSETLEHVPEHFKAIRQVRPKLAGLDGHGDAVPLQRNFRSVTLGCVAENAVGEPGDGGEHTDPADIAGDAPNRSVVLQDSPLRKQQAPIVFTAAKQRERLIAGIGHVRADIRQIREFRV
jgi:hypothetical protein